MLVYSFPFHAFLESKLALRLAVSACPHGGCQAGCSSPKAWASQGTLTALSPVGSLVALKMACLCELLKQSKRINSPFQCIDSEQRKTPPKDWVQVSLALLFVFERKINTLPKCAESLSTWEKTPIFWVLLYVSSIN